MKLSLSFHDKVFYANLLEKEAPHMIAELKKICPFESSLAYAKICDQEIFFQAPISKYEMENPVYSMKGHIAYYAPKQTICVWFGENPSLGDCDLFALLRDEDIELFKKEAQKVWDIQGERIYIDIVEDL